jgi:hypothetical protein
MTKTSQSPARLPKVLFATVILFSVFIYWQFNHQPARAGIFMDEGSTYEKEWKRVDSLANKGLAQSALNLTNQIYGKAKSDNNHAQVVKALIHRYKFSDQFQENSREFAIYDLQKEIKISKYPLTPVLHSMLGELYWQYYQQNRWKFSQRSQTSNFKNDSITTWSLNRLVAEAANEYQLSLQKADSLQKTKESLFMPVIEKGTAASTLRPTLYDFLAHRAIDFFSGEEPSVTRPADKFILDDAAYFSPAAKFAKVKLETSDTLAFKFYALTHLRDVIAFHLRDGNTNALVDADLKRLQFVYRNSVLAEKDSLFEISLRQLAANYPESDYTADVYYTLASYYYQQGNRYKPGQDETFKMSKKKALELCLMVVKRYPKTQGATNCDALSKYIIAKSFSMTAEQVTVPDLPSRALLTWKGVSKLHFRIAKQDEELHDGYDKRTHQEIMRDYLALPVVSEWELQVPDDSDFNSHSAEIKLPPLAHGHYILLASAEKGFPLDTNGISYASFWSSSISFLDRQLKDGSFEYFVFDRQTGEPLKDITAQVWVHKYDNGDRQYHYRRSDKLTTDHDGRFVVPNNGDYRNYLVEFTGNNDHLYSNENYQYRRSNYKQRKEVRTTFFTDRSIYRPGQIVYFKGIVIETDGETSEIMKNKSTTVTLFDVNYQKQATLDLVTNEFGSISGSFTAPPSGITGQMHIGNESGSAWFSVEEYKRPKFEVNPIPVKGAYRLNDSVRVTGIAKMFAGSPVDGAIVNYRVVRTANFPWWWYCYRGYYPQSAATEITNGTTTTNDTGGFVIPFKALPDRSVPAESKPTFTYQVYVDVTDITGETHSTSAYIRVGYVALTLEIDVPSYLEKSDTAGVYVNLANLSGQADSAVVSYSVKKLKEPRRIVRERTWSKPDRFIYSEDEWIGWFPEDPYKNETDFLTWEKGAVVTSGTINTGKEKYLHLKKSSWEQGAYVIESMTKDKYGQEVKDIRYFNVYDVRDKKPVANEPWSFRPIKSSAQPGEKAIFLVGTAVKNISVLYEIEQDEKVISRQWLRLSNEQKYIEIPVEEKHRGNFAVHFAFVYHNRSYTNDQQVYVAWESQQLDITFETFRDKLQPGQPEEWRLKIAGPKGEKVAAEMVAAMYDASLDEFRGHGWGFYIYKNYYGSLYWQRGVDGNVGSSFYDSHWNQYGSYSNRTYDHLNWFGFHYGFRDYYWGDYEGGVEESDYRGFSEQQNERRQNRVVMKSSAGSDADESRQDIADSTVSLPMAGGSVGGVAAMDGETRSEGQGGKDKNSGANLGAIKARTNLNETVFFYPNLQTDSLGNVIIKFTMNEALTKWKFMAFAHTKDLKYGQVTREVVTQKDLMIMPNPPRFLRENDRMTITAKVSNLADKDLEGTAQLMLFDALSMKPIDSKLLTGNAQVSFKVKKGQSAPLSWDLFIPVGTNAITYRFVASAGKFTDAEESALPVLSNRMLVTETMPLPIRGGQTKNFRFEKLISQGNGSTTLRNHKLTLEFTSNPAWYAVQALPYLIEYPYECSEQMFSRVYANSIATHIANSSPKIRAVFDAWKTQSPDAFLSNLEKNPELKNVVLTETPWVLEAQDETERKRRVGLLFDMNRMANEQQQSMRKLRDMQVSNGGWPWFEGMPDDRYITQYIITGFGRLDKLGVSSVHDDKQNWSMVASGVNYLDNRMREDYDWILKYDKAHMNDDHLGYFAIQYLYARSYFRDVTMSARNKEAFDYFFGQAKKYWMDKGRYMQGMLALATFRYKEIKTADDIMKSLGETALHSEEMGMYWKENSGGYYWYQAPIETQSLLIEAFKEVKADQKSVDDMRVWLLKNKQTNDWKTTTATANACYALLIDGTDWLATESDVQIFVGNVEVDPKKLDIKEEAGTGYFKTSWSGDAITPQMGEVKVSKSGPGVSWGAMYWQYFEDMDKITTAETPLKVNKKLFRVKNTASGPVIEPITESTVLHPGDKIRVRIELRTDRDMEYVHMKDMRASGFEPVNVISQYKWQDGLGYYESTKDASTDFFFGFLPKGTHVFEYPLTVIHAGDFSNGITQVQCMYAPEFSTHSEGLRVKVSKPI